MFSILSRRRQRAALLARTRRPPINVRRRFRPLLEALEDHLTPSTLTVTSTADDVNQPGTLRYDVAYAQSGDTILLTEAVESGIVLTQGELTGPTGRVPQVAAEAEAGALGHRLAAGDVHRA